jgi:hypothetical protein
MKKKASFRLYRIGAIAFTYVLLIGIGLVHYYDHYALLQSGMVVLVLVEFFVLPVFILATAVLNKRIRKGVFRFSRPAVFGGVGLTVLISFLFLGLIPFINSTVGRQKEKTLSGSLVKKSRESGRGGANRQYYETIYDDLSRQEYTLRGSLDYFYDKKVGDTLSVVVQEGSLGILYVENKY